MKGGSPAYAFHQSEGFLSQGTNVEHVKPLYYNGNSGDENFSNLYKVSGGGRKKRRILRKRNRVGKSKRSNCNGSSVKLKKNRRKSKKRLSRKKRGGSRGGRGG